MNTTQVRPGERRLERFEPRADASLHFIGRIHTPWTERGQCPKNVSAALESGVVARVVLEERWRPALSTLAGASHLILLYWLDRAARDMVVQWPRHADRPHGTFSLRSPNRPNPIGLAAVELLSIDGTELHVRGVDCLDGTPLLDIKRYFASIDAVPEATDTEPG